jgi:hypothetical protein
MSSFEGAYGVRGKPGWPPGRLALVTIFQKAENLTDRQAAEAVRTRIDWKYTLGLGLADPGFDDSILSEFRTRVATGGLDQVVLDTLLRGNTPDSTDRPCQQRQQRLNNKFRAGEDGCGRLSFARTMGPGCCHDLGTTLRLLCHLGVCGGIRQAEWRLGRWRLR